MSNTKYFDYMYINDRTKFLLKQADANYRSDIEVQ